MFFPHFKIFFLQTKRNIKQFVLQLALLCTAVTFCVASINLYTNSRQNLLTVEETYTTIATTEIYGYVTKDGKLSHPDDEACVGRHLLSVEGYDLSPILALDSVIDIDLRTRVGAYIPGHIQVYSTNEDDPFMSANWVQLFGTDTVIRFVLDSEVPMVISLQDEGQNLAFPIRVLDTTNSLLEYPDTFTLCVLPFDSADLSFFAEDIRRLNRSDCGDVITLYPNVDYVMATYGGWYWEKNPETGTYLWRADNRISFYDGIGLQLRGSSFYNYLSYGKLGLEAMTTSVCELFSLYRYEDVNADQTWEEHISSVEYNSSSFAVTLTDDITLLPAWHQGGMYLNEGRMISKEEYASGTKVCMVSAKMADNQGWQVGDKLDMHLYSYNAFYDEIIKNNGMPLPENYSPPPSYLKGCGGFFEEDTYEIVGIWSQREFANIGDTAEEVFYNPWNVIYIPANAAPNAPEGPIQPSLITLELKNGSITEFKAAVEEMGLTDQTTGKYEFKFSYFDQGYTKIQPGLMEMNKNVSLLLILSLVLLLVTMVLMAFLFVQQHKHSIGILRMLGSSKKQTFTAILTCAAAVVGAASAVGTILGSMLTQRVGAGILDEATSITTVELAVGASPALSILVGISCSALFLALVSICTAAYIGKEPNTLLSSTKK